MLNRALSGFGAAGLLACSAISRSFPVAAMDGADARAPSATLPTPRTEVISTAPATILHVAE